MTDVITRHRRNGTVRFASPAAEPLFGVPAKSLLGHGLFDRVHVGGPAGLSHARSRDAGAQGDEQLGRVPHPARSARARPDARPSSSGSRCAAARSIGAEGDERWRARSRRGDARRHRAQGAGAGARGRARGSRARQCRQEPLPRHHEPRAAHAAQRHHRLLRDAGERGDDAARRRRAGTNTPR